MIATLLAREGFRGPAKVFEGHAWIFHAFGGKNEYRFEKLMELGKEWEIPRLDVQVLSLRLDFASLHGLRVED